MEERWIEKGGKVLCIYALGSCCRDLVRKSNANAVLYM